MVGFWIVFSVEGRMLLLFWAWQNKHPTISGESLPSLIKLSSSPMLSSVNSGKIRLK